MIAADIRVLFVSSLALILGLSVFPLSHSLPLLLSLPVPLFPNGDFCLVMWWGCMTRLCLQRVSKKNRKTKEKHRNSAGYESRTGVVKERPGLDVGESLPGFASVFRSRPVIKPCPVRRSLSLTSVDSIREKKKKQNKTIDIETRLPSRDSRTKVHRVLL